MASYRVKRNISAALCVVGIVCIVSRAFEVAVEPSSGSRWFDLCGIVILTYICFDNFMIYRRRCKKNAPDL